MRVRHCVVGGRCWATLTTGLACLFPFALLAQQHLSGTVVGEGESPIAGAVVFLPEIRAGVLTDAAGHYDLTGLPQGEHLVQVSHVGYAPALLPVRLQGGETRQDFTLRPSQVELKQVLIFGTRTFSPAESPYRIEQIGRDAIRENGALSVSDAVAKLPGVSQLTTGAGISKPVIRGLYGNRVQVNVMGLRFDNQQWQDEHGLGLAATGIDRIEVIKGPAALAFGSDAIGGVLNVIEEQPAPVGTREQDIQLRLRSATRGIGGDYGYRKSSQDRWRRLRLSFDSNADYSSAHDTRVLNSRFATYNLKASTGRIRPDRLSTNSAYLSFSQFGFIFDTLQRKLPDARISRNFEGPHHSVLFGVASTENTFYRDRARFKLNAGLITNLRQEQEGGNRVSLNMLLNTLSANGQAILPLGKATWTHGLALMGQTNTNFGARTIVPDAFTWEAGLYSILQRRFGRGWMETGLRYDLRSIHTFATGNLNGPGSEVQPFNKTFGALNGNVGLAWNPVESLRFKVNGSSGYRAGNLAELSSNGLHEGTARWEIGNPDLKVEQNFCAEAGLSWATGEQVEVGGTAFANRFLNYIFLAPDGTEYVGFLIYRFMQRNATLKGVEFNLDIHPRLAPWLDLTANYTYLSARQDGGAPLPFIPANKVQAEVRLQPKAWGKVQEPLAKLGLTHVFAQTFPAEFETATPAYSLLNAALGGKFDLQDKTLGFTLAASNLADRRYADHLSRFKYYGIYNMGRNLTLTVNYQF